MQSVVKVASWLKMISKTLFFYVISYLFFLILLWTSKEKRGLRVFDDKGLADNLPMLIALHVGGIFLFGVIPLISSHPGTFRFLNVDLAGRLSTWITVIMFILSLIITPRIIKKKFSQLEENTPVYTSPGTPFYMVYFFIRFMFIGVYECWFRGFLLTDCIISFGIGWAILINVCLYAVLHIVNGKDEVIACIPYGLLLCTLCIWQGAVWPAVVIHLALTIPYELGFIRKMKTKISLQNESVDNRSLGLYRK